MFSGYGVIATKDIEDIISWLMGNIPIKPQHPTPVTQWGYLKMWEKATSLFNVKKDWWAKRALFQECWVEHLKNVLLLKNAFKLSHVRQPNLNTMH